MWAVLGLAVKWVWVSARWVFVEERAADFILVFPAVVLQLAVSMRGGFAMRRHQGDLRPCVARRRPGYCRPWWAAIGCCTVDTGVQYSGGGGVDVRRWNREGMAHSWGACDDKRREDV